MRWICYGYIFALTAACLVGATGCSDPPRQKEANVAEVPSGAEAQLAVDEPPEGFAESQPQQAKPNQEKPDGKVVEIPLDQIWAWRMPGTRPMSASMRDGQYITEEGPLLDKIRRSLAARPSVGKEANPGFAVVGSGLEAMKAAHDVLVEGHESQQTFSDSEEISLAFFSYQFSRYVHLHRVERRGNVVELRYRFVPHFSETTTEHFALIPLGRLIAGKYLAEISMSPMEQRYIRSRKPVDPDTARRIVCRSFPFSVSAD